MNHVSQFSGSHQVQPFESSGETLRDDYLSQIFMVLAASFGTQFTAKWEGTNPAAMKAVWGQKLRNYNDQPEAIRGALNEACEMEFPPNLGEFYKMCQRRYQKAPDFRPEAPRLTDKASEEERARRGEKARNDIMALYHKLKMNQ
jgi:hypothetical protein